MPPKRDTRNVGKGRGKMKEKVVEEEPFNPCDVLKPMALVAGFKKNPDKLDDKVKEVFLLQIKDCEEKLAQ